jgi:hypothetical protein
MSRALLVVGSEANVRSMMKVKALATVSQSV